MHLESSPLGEQHSHPLASNEASYGKVAPQTESETKEEQIKHLFKKRKADEWMLANRGGVTNDVYKEALAKDREEMRSLGVTEEDYFNFLRGTLH